MRILLAFALALGLAGPAHAQANEADASIGAVIGGVLGGLAGSYFGSESAGGVRAAATAVGAALGAWFGDAAYGYLTETDRALAAEAEQREFADGDGVTTASWRNPDSGAAGRVEADRIAADEDGACRAFRHRIETGNGTETVEAQACRNPDGSWRVVRP